MYLCYGDFDVSTGATRWHVCLTFGVYPHAGRDDQVAVVGTLPGPPAEKGEWTGDAA